MGEVGGEYTRRQQGDDIDGDGVVGVSSATVVSSNGGDSEAGAGQRCSGRQSSDERRSLESTPAQPGALAPIPTDGLLRCAEEVGTWRSICP